jgi:tetratricopeptide (TPR) repeat protein
MASVRYPGLFLAKTFALLGLLLLVSCSSTQPVNTGIAQSTHKSALGDQYRGDYAKALADLEANNNAQAANALTKVMANNPGFVAGWANLALAQLRAGDAAKAKQAMDNALQLDPQSAPLKNLAGLIAVEIGTYKDAEQYYEQALQLNPNLANAHYNLALLNDIHYQNVPKAIEHYERYIALINTADPDTEAWITELKRNLK